MTWVDLTTAFAYGSSPTSEQLQNLRDNLAAIAAADSGAPTFKTAALASSSVKTASIAAANIDRSKLKTSGGSASGSIPWYGFVGISMQDYCFDANIGRDTEDVYLVCYGAISAVYTGRLVLASAFATAWGVYWRYVTASDKPFIYAIQNENGEFIGVWECDDPPPELWGHDKKPVGFRAPLVMMDSVKKVLIPAKEIIQFNVDKEFIADIRGKAETDKMSFSKVLNGYDFNGSVFEPKTILEF